MTIILLQVFTVRTIQEERRGKVLRRVATLQKNAGAISRYSQQYLAEIIFHSTNEKKLGIKFCFAGPLNLSTVGQYFVGKLNVL